MRVMHVSHGWDQGGSALYAAAVAAEAERQGARVLRFGPADLPARRGRGFRASFVSPDVEAAFSARLPGVEVVHVHHLSGLSMALPRLAREAGAAVVVTLHDYDLACARGQLVDREGARCAGPEPRRCAACLAPHLWAPIPEGLSVKLPLRLAPVAERAEAWRSVVAATNLFLAPSAHAGRRMGVEAEVWPMPLIQSVPPAADPAPGPVRFLFLGGSLPTKGPDVVLAAFASLPAGAANLRMIGPEAPWRGSFAWAAALRARVAATPGVSVTGSVTHDAVVAELHAADVLVVPSTWEETGSLVAAEATAAGLRVLASDLGGIPEVAPEARLVEPGSVPAWRRAMVEEIRRGRGRVTAGARPDLADHVARLLERYAALRRR